MRDLILDGLRYCVMEMHVDGFRFDLASVLGRDVNGRVAEEAPLLERIAEDPILRGASKRAPPRRTPVRSRGGARGR